MWQCIVEGHEDVQVNSPVEARRWCRENEQFGPFRNYFKPVKDEMVETQVEREVVETQVEREVVETQVEREADENGEHQEP